MSARAARAGCGLPGLELDQLGDRVDQRQMRERLRVVPQVLPADGVEFFGVQVQRAAGSRAAADTPRANEAGLPSATVPRAITPPGSRHDPAGPEPARFPA